MNHSETLDLLATALSAAQGQFEAVGKDSNNPFFKSKYASLPNIVQHATPILVANGLSVSQLLGHDEHGDTLTTVLLHKSGQYLADTMHLRPVKNDPQAQGSATTYGRRYAYMAALGLVADEDDDGDAASKAAEAPKRSGKQTTEKRAPKPAAKPADDRPLPADLEALRAAAAKAGADWQTLGMHLVAIDVDASDGTEITKESVAQAIVALTPEKYAALMGRLS